MEKKQEFQSLRLQFTNSTVHKLLRHHLAEQVIPCVLKEVKIPLEFLSYLTALQADGQRQAKDFLYDLKTQLGGEHPSEHQDKYFIVPWDTGYWLDCSMEDVRTKDERGKALSTLVLRCNKFHHVFGHGRGFAKENNLKAQFITNYSTTGLLSVLLRHSSKCTTIMRRLQGLTPAYVKQMTKRRK